MLDAEQIAAITGIFPSAPPGADEALASTSVVSGWEHKVKAFTSGKRSPFKWTPPTDSSKFHKKLAEPMDEAEVAGYLGAFGDNLELGAAYYAVIKSAREYLLNIWPTVSIPGIVATEYPLSTDDRDAIWSVYRALDDPDNLVADLCSWTLTRAKAEGFRAVYPDLSAQLDQLVQDGLTAVLMRGEQIAWQVQDMVRIWSGKKLDEPIVQTKEKEADPAVVAGSDNIDFKASEVPSERRSNG